MTPNYKVNDIVKLNHRWNFGIVFITKIENPNNCENLLYYYKVLSGNPCMLGGTTKYAFYRDSFYSEHGQILGAINNKLARLFYL